MIISRLQVFVILLLMIGFYIFSESYVALYLLMVTIILILTSFIILMIHRRKITIEIQAPISTYKNENGDMYIKLINRSIFPSMKIKSTILFHNQLTNETLKEEIYLTGKGRENKNVLTKWKSKHIGHITAEVMAISLYDYFNIFSMSIPASSKTDFYVLPHCFNIDVVKKTLAMGQGDTPVYPTVRESMEAMEMIGLKEYEEGDQAKRIHWKLSTKLDRLIVKEFSNPVDDTIFILYENGIQSDADAINASIEVFLSLSKSLLENKYEHTMAWFDHESDQLRIEKVYSFEQLLNLQSLILSINHKENDSTSLSEFIALDLRKRYAQQFYITSANTISTEEIVVNTGMTPLICATRKNSTELANEEAIVFTPSTAETDLHQLTM